MKKSMVAIVLFISVFLTGCEASIWPNDTVSRDKIVSYVKANYKKLEKFPYSEIQQVKSSSESAETKDQKEKDVIKKYLGSNTIVKSVYAYNDNILQFYCGGSGFVGGSTYTGFYFSLNDKPFAMEFDGIKLTEIQPNVFEWQNEDGSHKFHTEKIQDNWYYYLQDWY